MNYTITNITSVASLRKMAKEIGYDDFKAFAEKVSTVANELKEQREQEAYKLEEIKQKIKDHYELMQEELAPFGDLIDNPDLDALTNLFLKESTEKPTKASTSQRAPKYIYISDDGTEKTWTGFGPIPGPIKKEIDAGTKKKEDFLIKHD